MFKLNISWLVKTRWLISEDVIIIMNFIPVIRIEDVFCYLTVYSVMSTSHVKGTEHP